MSFIEYIRKLANDETIQINKSIRCLNPDHEDKNPSMRVYRNHAYCYSCGYKIAKDKEPKKVNIRDYVMRKFLELCKEEDPIEFCKIRKYNLERIKKLNIGVATSDVYSKLIEEFDYYNLKKAKLVDSKGRHKYVGRTIIPFNNNYFSARSNTTPGVNSVSKNLFPAGITKVPYIIEGEDPLIICEGEPDAIALHHIFPNNKILACCGVSGLSNKLDFYLKQRTNDEVIICFDNDEAGSKALNEIKKEMSKYPDIKFKRIVFSDEKDIDDLFRKYQEKTINETELLDLTSGINIEDLDNNERELLTNPSLLKLIIKKVNEEAVGEKMPITALILSYIGSLVVNKKATSFHVLLNDLSGAGKDHITYSCLNVLQPGFRDGNNSKIIYRNKISPQVFTYWHNSKQEPEWSWNGKILYIEDISKKLLTSEVFKVMLSGGSYATVVINQKAVDIEIIGKPQVICTMAHGTPNDEMMRRFFLMQVDCSNKQTRDIMYKMAEDAESCTKKDKDSNLISKSLNSLNSVTVKIPYSKKMALAMPNTIYMRTHFNRFLDFIRASACLHQFQRKKNSQVVEANEEDYNIVKSLFEYSASTAGMTPIPKSLREILEIFERFSSNEADLIENEFNYFSVMTLECKAHFEKSELYKRLNKLVELRVITKKKHKSDNPKVKQSIAVYAIDQSKLELTLPSFDELNNNSIFSTQNSCDNLGKNNNSDKIGIIDGIEKKDRIDKNDGIDGIDGKLIRHSDIILDFIKENPKSFLNEIWEGTTNKTSLSDIKTHDILKKLSSNGDIIQINNKNKDGEREASRWIISAF